MSAERDIPDLQKRLVASGLWDQFKDSCRACFQGQSGENLLECLLNMAHPLFPPVGNDPYATYREIGRQEVIAILARFSGIPFGNFPYQPNQPTP